jgi:hypothetical protein
MEKIDDQSGGTRRPDIWLQPAESPKRRKALAAGTSTYAPRTETGNALALVKLCGTKSVMSTVFTLLSLRALRHDSHLPVTSPRHAVAD